MGTKDRAYLKTPEFNRFSKTLYLHIILNELKKDPGLWITFSHEKQVEIHEIKKELDEYYKNEKKEHLKKVLGPYGKIGDDALTKLVEEENF